MLKQKPCVQSENLLQNTQLSEPWYQGGEEMFHEPRGSIFDSVNLDGYNANGAKTYSSTASSLSSIARDSLSAEA